MRVSSLHIYPLKSGRGIDLQKADVRPRGFAHDRRWLAVGEEKVALTQRDTPDLARVVITPTEKGVRLSSDIMDDAIDVSFPDGDRRDKVWVWRDEINAARAGDETNQWLSKALGKPAQLFHMDDKADRKTPELWGEPVAVGFADEFPVLIAASASLDALNVEIEKNGGAKIGMERFRTNIVIDGADAWAEDFWKEIRIGDVAFDVVRPCDRCKVTTLDQRDGSATGKEPLTSLAKLRRSQDPRINGVLFGWRMVPKNEGVISVGDDLEILSTRPEGWPLG